LCFGIAVDISPKLNATWIFSRCHQGCCFSTVLPDVPNAFSDGSTARLGLLRIGPDDTSGTFLAFVPSVSARYDF